MLGRIRTMHDRLFPWAALRGLSLKQTQTVSCAVGTEVLCMKRTKALDVLTYSVAVQYRINFSSFGT